MNSLSSFQTRRLPVILLGILAAFVLLGILLFIVTQTAAAQSVETGNVCIDDYRPGSNCTANDVGLTIVNEGAVSALCSSGALTATLDLLVDVQPNSPDRYDIGIFIAQDGNSAQTGDNCYHAMMSPITSTLADVDGLSGVGPFWDGDSDACGDVAQSLASPPVGFLYELQSVTVPCDDPDQNGFIEVSACTSWDNNTNSTCSDVTDAFPGTVAKCNCISLQIPLAPTAITMDKATIEQEPLTPGVIVAGLFLLAVTTFAILRRRSEKNISHL